MPEAPTRVHERLLVGGHGPVRFAVALDQVVGVREHSELPPRRREVNVPLIFDLPPAAPEEDRYAEVQGLDEPAYLRLGTDVRAEQVADDHVWPLPRALATTAARWGWAALGLGEKGAIVLIDARALARIGALRERSGGEA